MGLVLIKIKDLLLPSPLYDSATQEKKINFWFLEENEAGQRTS